MKNKKDLSSTELKKVAKLLLATWPPQDESIRLENVIANYKHANAVNFNKVFLCFDNENLIGHTEVFEREIIIDSGKKEIMALAAVCVDSAYRGKNIGAKLVSKAFSFVNSNQYECSIFQTNVPLFYEKLACKKIFNRFINSQSKTDISKNPWRDPNVMIYPNTISLGEGVIDLNGECY